MALGSGSLHSPHNKNELFTLTASEWIVKKEYPDASAIHYFSILTVEKKFILFGGWNPGATQQEQGVRVDTIARFDPAKNKWKTLGKLKKTRARPCAVQLDNEFIIVGGKQDKDGNVATESCKFTKPSKMICTERKPELPTDVLSFGISN